MLKFAAVLVAFSCVEARLFGRQAGNAAACPTDEELIKSAQDFDLCMYRETLSKKICWDYNLKSSDAQADVESVGGDYAVLLAGGCLTQTQCDGLFEKQLERARQQKESFYGAEVGCQCADYVLVDMVFALGLAGVSHLNYFNNYIHQKLWEAAGSDLTVTMWDVTDRERCERDAD